MRPANPCRRATWRAPGSPASSAACRRAGADECRPERSAPRSADRRAGPATAGTMTGDGDVHVLAVEVDQPLGCNDPKFDLGMRPVEGSEAQNQPSRRECKGIIESLPTTVQGRVFK